MSISSVRFNSKLFARIEKHKYKLRFTHENKEQKALNLNNHFLHTSQPSYEKDVFSHIIMRKSWTDQISKLQQRKMPLYSRTVYQAGILFLKKKHNTNEPYLEWVFDCM